jgi:O-antigen ligase
LIFLAVPVVTLIWSPTTVESLRGIFRFVGYYALMWLIVDSIRTREQVRHMVVALIVSLVIPIATGFYQAITGGGQVLWAGALLNRIYGFAGGPFTLAYYLVMLIPLVLVFILVEREREDPFAKLAATSGSGISDVALTGGLWRFNRFWLGVLLVAALVALVMTFIRGAWLALVVSLIVLGLARGSLRFRQLVVTIPALVVAVLVTFSSVLNRLAEVADPNSTFFGRLEVWKLAWDWITSSPLAVLAGVGMKAFEYHYILLAGPTTAGLYWRRESFLVGNRPHNELLGFTLDVGVIGTVAFIAVLAILIRLAVRVYRQSPDPSLKLVALAFAIGAVGLFVGAMGDNVFSQPSVAVYFWILGGLVMAIYRHMLPDGDEPAPPSSPAPGDPRQS